MEKKLFLFLIYIAISQFVIAQTYNDSSVSYTMTLSSEGKFRNKEGVLGEVLYTVPSGALVGVYSKQNGYYKVKYNNDVGYLSEMYFVPNIKPIISNSIASTSFPSQNPTDEEGKAMDSWLNSKIDELILQLGAPNGVTTDGKDGKIYIFVDTRSHTIRGVKMPKYDNSKSGLAYRINYPDIPSKTQVITRSRMFYVNNEGVIYYWLVKKSDGN